jgi:DNA-binding transcriptional LysR family regulator
LTFSQLRVLQAVARAGNMTRAAAELGTTQPAVSHALRSLERELDMPLLIRRSDGVALTAVGRAVSHRAALILNQLEGLSQELAAARGNADGRLRLGVIPSVNARLMPRLLRAFRATHDRVHLTVLEGSDDEVLEWVKTGAVDVATVTSTAGDLATTTLACDRMLALLPAAHPLAARTVVAVRDLAREPFIMSTGGCEPHITELARRAGVRLRSHYRVRDTNSIIAMVAEHLGVTIMPELALPSSPAGVCAVPLEPAEQRTILLALPSDGAPLPLARAFVEHVCHAVDASAVDGSSNDSG